MGYGVVQGDKYYRGFANEYRIDVHDQQGNLRRSIRRAWTPPPVTEDDLAALHAASLTDRERGLAERFMKEAVPAKTHPAYTGFLVDPGDNLWVQNTRPEDGLRIENVWSVGPPSTWSVFDPNGEWLGDVTLPVGMRVTDIGSDYILGVWRNEDNVEDVRSYPIRK